MTSWEHLRQEFAGQDERSAQAAAASDEARQRTEESERAAWQDNADRSYQLQQAAAELFDQFWATMRAAGSPGLNRAYSSRSRSTTRLWGSQYGHFELEVYPDGSWWADQVTYANPEATESEEHTPDDVTHHFDLQAFQHCLAKILHENGVPLPQD
jgi:hypothetical protein